MNDWNIIHYRQALEGLRREVDPSYDAPGKWSTFLRGMIQVDIAKLRLDMTQLAAIHDPAQQRMYNVLQGRIEGLKRLLQPDFGIGRRLEEIIAESAQSR